MRPGPGASPSGMRRPWLRLGLTLALLWSAGARAGSEVESLLAADRAFALQSVQQGRQAAFLSWMGDGATLFREGGAPLEGRAAIQAAVGRWSPLVLDWHPLHADVSASGDLGYTWGEYVASGAGSDGKPFELRGRYVTIWKRATGGDWRWVVDIGN